MKKSCLLIILAAVTSHLIAQTRTVPAQWSATVGVNDESGNPLPGAKVVVMYNMIPTASNKGAESEQIVGFTDTNGVFNATHRDASIGLGFQVQKDGYYSGFIRHNIGFSPETNPGRLNPNVSLTLKRVVRPVAMYARRVDGGPPATNQPIGFDLMSGDWVAPYGHGQTTDITFTKAYSKTSPNDYNVTLTVSFPNPSDGLQEFLVKDKLGEGCRLRSAYAAPIDGYQAEVVRENSQHPGQPGKFDYDEKRNYFFRVRTVVDESGSIKTALYGKIYGDFMHFTYYLNPQPNSRNVEFDPKQNLLAGQHVDSP